MITRQHLRLVRSGFSLIELLVVLSIIVVLASLTTAAVMKFRETGPRTATKSSLTNMKAKLDNQMKAVRDKAQSETIRKDILQAIQVAVGATTPTDPRVRQQYIRLRLTQAFPQSFAEAVSTNMGLPPWDGYARYLTSLGCGNGTSPAGTPENAICLMMILERGPSNPGVTPDQLGSTAAKPFTLNGKQAFGCVDAWGDPLAFTRGDMIARPQVPATIQSSHGISVP